MAAPTKIEAPKALPQVELKTNVVSADAKKVESTETKKVESAETKKIEQT